MQGRAKAQLAQDLNSDKKQMTGIFKPSGNKTEMFFIGKKNVEEGEYLIDRRGRKFKSQFNARRKDLGDVFFHKQ